MYPALWLGSEGYDECEEAKLILARAQGIPYARTFRCEVVYELRHERRYFKEIDALLSDPQRWAAHPPGTCNQELNCLAFRTLESTDGVVVWNLTGPDAVGYPK